MLDKIFKLIQRWAASSERDRIDDRFDRFNQKIDHLDARIDKLENSQATQTEKLSAIHTISLANNEDLEQKLNRAAVTTDSVRQIVDARMEGFETTIKYIQSLVEQILKRDCNTP
ncbi:MAG: hypothetical protein ACK5L1_15070 [Pseudanabaena sp.]